MFDTNNFDKAVKAAEKLENILRRSKNLAALSGIESGLRSLTQATSQAERLLSRTKLLARESSDLAYRQAGITKETYRRVKFYDQELAAVKRNRTELQAAARAEQTRFDNNKRKQLSANAAAQANLAAELSRRSQLMDDLAAEYNLRMSMSGFDSKAAEVANDLAVNNAKLLELQSKLKSIESQRLNIENARSQKLDQITTKLEEQNKIEEATNALKAADKAQQKAVQRQNFKDFVSDKFMGGLLGQFKQLTGALKGLGVALGIFAVFGLLLKAVLGAYRDGLKATIDLGLDASQRVSEVLQGQKVVAEALKRGALISLEDAIRAKGALTEVFGTLDIPNELIVKSAELTRQLGLSSEEVASIFDFFGRIRGESAAAAATSAVVLKATALSNRANPAQVMRDVAANAANFAKSGRASADELARAAILVRRMGVDLGTIANIADRIVTDFEGTLESQATLAAFNPGADMSELVIASVAGTDEEIAMALKRTVDSLGDPDTMLRPQLLSNAASLGISVEQLKKIAKSTDGMISMVSPDAEAMIKAEETKINELQKAVVNPLDSIEKSIFGIFSFLTSRFGSKTEQSVAEVAKLSDADLQKQFVQKAGSASDFIETMLKPILNPFTGFKPQSQVLMEEMERREGKTPAQKAESRAVGGVVGVDRAPMKSLKGIFKNLTSNEVPTILHKGEAVLNQAQMNMLGQLTGMQSQIAKSLTGFVNNFTEQIASPSGLIGKLTNTIAGNNSNSLLGTLTKTFSSGSGGIMGKIGGLFDKKSGGGSPVASIAQSLTGGSGGIMGKVSGLLGGNLKNTAANLVGKIPGIGGIASSLMKGGGIKGIGSSLLKGGIAKLGGAKIGAAIGSIIPGAGTAVGALLGTGISKLANTRIGKAVTGFIGKSPIGQIGKKVLGTAGKALGGIGKKLGGLFGRKKKPAPTPQPDMTQIANMSGMLGMMPMMTAANFQSGINFANPSMMTMGGTVAGQPGQTTNPMQSLEAKFDTLINLFKSGGIVVNLDGKKVSDGLVDANRYG